eukprot:Em0009g1127a
MCCLELLCCCFGPAACGLCCGGLGVKSSITTRLLYTVILLLTLILSSIMLAPQVQTGLAKTPYLCQNYVYNASIPLPTLPPNPIGTVPTAIPVTSVSFNKLLDCSVITGYLAVYRVCMAVASFFLVFMLFTVCVFSTKDPRSYVHNGFWLFKFIAIIGLIVGFFFINTKDSFAFATAAMVIGYIGAIIFILIQVVVLVDFAHSWAESWLNKKEENDNPAWLAGLIIFTCIFYLISVVATILFYVYFTELNSCSLNKFFITSNLVFGVVVSVVAILPWVQRVQPKSGLLQPSVITLYCTYLTWSALTNEPYGSRTSFVANYNATGYPINVTNVTQYYDCKLTDSVDSVFGSSGNYVASSVVGIAILLVIVAYTSIFLSTNQQWKNLRGASKGDEESTLMSDIDGKDEKAEPEKEGDEDKGNFRMTVLNDEKEAVTYSYSFFHFLMMLGVLYAMMQLTNWSDPGSANSERFLNTWASVWVKMATVWISYAMFLWTLVAPLVLFCRDFGYDGDD